MKYYNQSTEEVLKALGTSATDGLNDSEAISRKEKYGPNALEQGAVEGPVKRFIKQFEDFMIWVLLAASGISFFIGEEIDAIIILFIVFLNAILGFIQENNAEKSLQALKKMQIPTAQVLRNGTLIEIQSPELVPGDIVQLNAGDYVPADGRIIECANFKIEESQLTGESVPVEKNADQINEDEVTLGDRHNMVFSTSLVTSGRATIIITDTGMETEIGKIADLLNKEEDEKTPLQIRLAELGKLLGIAAIAICALIFVIGILQGRERFEMFMIAISLAVAAIPEGLPAIVTIVLSLGVQKMIEHNAIVRKLPAVETLGSASVICSDKTGTLTQNKMTVVKIYIDEIVDAENISIEDAQSSKLLDIAILCNDSSLSEEDGKMVGVGDPTETALVFLGHNLNIEKKGLLDKKPRIGEIPFDSDRKLMSTLHQEDSIQLFTKGAPDQLLDRCTNILTKSGVESMTETHRKSIFNSIETLSEDALRVLAFAYKEYSSKPAELNPEKDEQDLIFVGLMGMIDPPRLEVKDAIEVAKHAGIKTVMITGDYKVTAAAIAKDLSILEEGDIALSGSELTDMTDAELEDVVEKISVYARVSPEQKIRIVKAWKAKNRIVSMTGDGVNDAPALKAADIGCAMGITGTDVSKEASDLILTDDNFTTIVHAVEEGRVIYANIKKSINFLLSSNMGEIFTLLVAILMNMASPLLAIHILWINLVTDSFPALALGVEPMEEGIMDKKPRNPDASFLADGLGLSIVLQGLMIAALTLTGFIVGLKTDVITGRTMAFLVLSMTQLSHSLNVRSRSHSLFKMGFFSNKQLNKGISVSFILMILVATIPPVREIFKLTTLSMNLWGLTFGLGLCPILIMEIVKATKKNK